MVFYNIIKILSEELRKLKKINQKMIDNNKREIASFNLLILWHSTSNKNLKMIRKILKIGKIIFKRCRCRKVVTVAIV